MAGVFTDGLYFPPTHSRNELPAPRRISPATKFAASIGLYHFLRHCPVRSLAGRLLWRVNLAGVAVFSAALFEAGGAPASSSALSSPQTRLLDETPKIERFLGCRKLPRYPASRSKCCAHTALQYPSGRGSSGGPSQE